MFCHYRIELWIAHDKPTLFLCVGSVYIAYSGIWKEGLKEGQIIVLGTDGIWEAQNPEGKMFGKEALCRIIRENADAGANALLDIIIDALDRFRDGFNLQDDVTLIVVKVGKA